MVVLSVFTITSCTENWKDHYDTYPETVDENVWDAMQSDPEISVFVQILKDLKYDTLFIANLPYTLFVPTNEAISQYGIERLGKQSIIDYHISSHFIQSGSIVGKRRIQTMTKKFALFEKSETHKHHVVK